jgi:aromatic ring-opening dioxygenase catalytic subunit (LigB family)
MMGKPSKDYDPVKDGTGRGQYSFDFKDWKDAFATYYRKKRMDSDYCLVISTHWVTSGYWVERNAKKDVYSTIYRSVKAVQALEQRVKNAIEAARIPRMEGGKIVMKEVTGLGFVVK